MNFYQQDNARKEAEFTKALQEQAEMEKNANAEYRAKYGLDEIEERTTFVNVITGEVYEDTCINELEAMFS